MSTLHAFIVLGLVLTIGTVLSRRAQQGYIDFLTPMLAMYFLHALTRGLFMAYGPEWLSLNPQVAAADEQEVAEALLLTAAGAACLIIAYLAITCLARTSEPAIQRLELPRLRLAVHLLVLGLACRVGLRLANESVIPLPDWAMTPVETLGWTTLAGLFLAGFRWGRTATTRRQDRGTMLAIVGTAMCIVIDGRLSSSREAVLQPILVVLAGVMIGRGAGLRRIAVAAAIVGVPIFLWIGAMKTYHDYDLGSGPGYTESVSAVQQYLGLDWLHSVVGSIQDRFHGLDSLIVCRMVVPSRRPYEEGSVWSQIVLSAFVPRVIFPEKQVGWGARFAVEFWGVRPEDEGSAAVGISHLGEFYIYGGDAGCLTSMAVLGTALGLLAWYLRRRRDVLGLMMFVLVAFTICQVDRDLDVAVGGVLKLLTIFSVLMLLQRTRLQRRVPDGAIVPSSRRPSARVSPLSPRDGWL